MKKSCGERSSEDGGARDLVRGAFGPEEEEGESGEEAEDESGKE